MKDSLVAKINDKWETVDLLSPSGITIEFVSPIFKGYDNFTSDKTYSFEIPLTEHNRTIFAIADDIRTENNLGKRYECKYSVDGEEVKGKCFLYISGYDNKLHGVMTLNILQELITVKEGDENLNELNIKEEDDFQMTILETFAQPNPLGQIVGQATFVTAGEDPQDREYGNTIDDDIYDELHDPERDDPEIEVPDWDYDGPDYDAPDYE